MKSRKEVGQFLKSRRFSLGLSSIEVATSLVCNRTTVERMEHGRNKISKSKIPILINLYKLTPAEVADLFGDGYENGSNASTSSGMDVCVEDLEFLIGIAKDLNHPMKLSTIMDLLKARRPKP